MRSSTTEAHSRRWTVPWVHRFWSLCKHKQQVLAWHKTAAALHNRCTSLKASPSMHVCGQHALQDFYKHPCLVSHVFSHDMQWRLLAGMHCGGSASLHLASGLEEKVALSDRNFRDHNPATHSDGLGMAWRQHRSTICCAMNAAVLPLPSASTHSNLPLKCCWQYSLMVSFTIASPIACSMRVSDSVVRRAGLE